MDRNRRRVLQSSLALMLLSLLAVGLAAPQAVGQLPGMHGEERAGASPETSSERLPAAAGDHSAVRRLYLTYFGEDSPYRPVILVVATMIVLVFLKRRLTRYVRAQVESKVFFRENAEAFLKTWNIAWKFVIGVLVIMAMSGSLRLLGLTAGFLGMMLGWSLQQPVTGIAAWLMIILKKPFRVGDRVIIAGITGDVTNITLTHVVLNQVGGSVGGEERSGRGILIPNAILFQHVIINYTLEQKFMLDEVPVRLTFDSDWERAKELMLQAAQSATAEIIRECGQQPFIRAEFLEWGILARLRYQTIPARRQEISTAVVEALLASFRKEFPRVKFAIPSTHIRYEPVGGQRDAERRVAV